jgi:hypothetical protein
LQNFCFYGIIFFVVKFINFLIRGRALKTRTQYDLAFEMFKRGDDVQLVARALDISHSLARELKRCYLADRAEANRFYLEKLEWERKEAVASVMLEFRRNRIRFLEERVYKSSAERHADTVFKAFPEVKEIETYSLDGPVTIRRPN